MSIYCKRKELEKKQLKEGDILCFGHLIYIVENSNLRLITEEKLSVFEIIKELEPLLMAEKAFGYFPSEVNKFCFPYFKENDFKALKKLCLILFEKIEEIENLKKINVYRKKSELEGKLLSEGDLVYFDCLEYIVERNKLAPIENEESEQGVFDICEVTELEWFCKIHYGKEPYLPFKKAWPQPEITKEDYPSLTRVCVALFGILENI